MGHSDNDKFLSNSILSINLAPTSALTKEVCEDDDSGDATLIIRCLSELTPLDMMDMSFGIADPTGSCVWTGAFLFMEMFSRELNSRVTSDVRKYWSHLRSVLFPSGCHALELGAGTGISGLSLMTPSFGGNNRRVEHDDDGAYRDDQAHTPACRGPLLMVLTDVNADALELCRINCDANIRNDKKARVHVKKLEWGKSNASNAFSHREETHPSTKSSNKPLPLTYDVVFATDVLYDLQSLAPLVATASEMLKDDGHFILSHVPRASIDKECYPSVEGNSWQQLESIIINEASKACLSLASFPLNVGDVSSDDVRAAIQDNNEKNSMILRPSLLRHIWGASSPLSNKFPWQEMMDIGAAILVFRKRDAKA